MLWRFYVYLPAALRGEVLFKLNGAKLSERGIETARTNGEGGGMQIIIAGR